MTIRSFFVLLACLVPQIVAAQTTPDSIGESDRPFESAIYEIAAGHWVELTPSGAMIANQGTATHFTWGFIVPRIRFLEPRHSVLASGTPATTRHFVEVFTWVPERPGRNVWQLTWHLFEVAGNDLIAVPVDPILAVSGSEPSHESTVDAPSWASVYVNEAGGVEWRAGKGADARRGGIPARADSAP